jgi:hypothetical protein
LIEAGQIRRYARHNQLNRLLTLTYREAPADRGAVVRDLHDFFKCVRAHVGAIPLVAVIERGRRGTRRLHVHLAFHGYLALADVRWWWWHGNVHLGDGRRCPYKPEVRRLSGYLAKYVAKSTAADAPEELERDRGVHRYLLTQGFQPPRIRERFVTGTAGERWLGLVYGPQEASCDFGEEGRDVVWGRWYVYPDWVIDRWRGVT